MPYDGVFMRVVNKNLNFNKKVISILLIMSVFSNCIGLNVFDKFMCNSSVNLILDKTDVIDSGDDLY